jgi:hypothetical protein
MKNYYLFLVAVVLAFSVNAQNIMLRSGNVGITKSNDQFTGFKASFSYDQIESVTITETERGTFSALIIAGAYPAGEFGTPELPIFRKMIAVPVGATPKVVIRNFTATEYSLEEYGIHKIFPRQPDVRKDQDLSTLPFVYDEKAYDIDDYNHSPIAEVQVLGTMRGINVGVVDVYPVQYNPVNHSIMVYNDIDIEVIFDNADYKKNEEMLIGTFSPYFKNVYETFFNNGVTKDVYDDHPDLYSTPVHMLVIANRMFEATLQPWIEWKTKKGFYMDVNYTDEIGTTAAAIKAFCHNKYNQGSSNGTAPTFLIFVGDTPQLPASQTGSSSQKATDLYYATLDNGYFPSMYYSRMSAQNVQNLANQIEKILYYEKYEFADPTYLDNVLLIAGADATWAPRVGRPQIEYAATNYYNANNGYANVHKYVTSNYSGCYAHLNNVGFANYTAHCGETSWGDPSFTASQVSTLTNLNKYFVAMGNCCLAADFGYTGNGGICFGEAMMIAEKKGAVGYIGSSPNSYWGDDFHFSVGAYAGSITVPTNPTPENTKTGVYDFMFRDADFNTLCSHVFGGNLSVTYAHTNSGYTVHTSSPRYYWEAYNVLGDGSLMPYNGQAADNTVSHLPVIYIGLNSYEVMADPGSYVAISKDGVLLGVAVADASGVALVPITPITSGGDVDIVVTRNQRKPYMNQVPAVAQEGPYVVYGNYQVVGADVLTYISTNQEIEVTLKNVGIETTGALNVTISCTDPQLIITQATATCGTIAPDGTATVSFNVTVTNDILDNKTFFVDVIVANGGKTTWESKMPLKAFAPKFKLEKVLVNGSEGGALPKGTVTTLTAIVKNEGGADAYAAMGSLEINSLYVNLACEDQINTVQNIPAGESVEYMFYVITNSDMPFGHEANFILDLEAQYGRTFSVPFTASNSGADAYCTPGNTNCSTHGDRITSLILVKKSDQTVLINNPNPTCNSNGYTDYTNISVEFEPGVEYTVKVKTGYANHRVRGWIDLNGNKEFDANEVMFTVSCASVNVEYTQDFTIPQDFVPGDHRFRIRTRDGSTIPGPCDAYSWGQTLDYTAVLPELYPRVQNVVAIFNDDEAEITINWGAPASGTPMGYNIYRNNNKLNSALLTATSFVEEDITQGVYAYNVTAVYTGNKESFAEMSNVVCNFIPPVFCEKPVNLSGVAENNNAKITWNKPENIDGNLLGYNIYRDDEKIGQTSEPVREYLDQNLLTGTYIYRVGAKYAHCEESDLTEGVSVQIYNCEKPINLSGVADECVVVINWTAPESIVGILKYNIYRDGEPVAEVEHPGTVHRDEVTANGIYAYKVSAVYEHCEESDFTEEVTVEITCIGINEITTDAFQIFPNPAKGELNISGSIAPTHVSIYNLTGQLVYETGQCVANMKISVSSFPSGIYFIKIISENGIVTKKVVVEN